MTGRRGSHFDFPGLLGHVLALSEDGPLVAFDLGKRQAGKLRHVRGGGTAADPRLDIPRGHGNGGHAGRCLRRRPAGRPQRFIDRQLEHLAAGTAQQEMLSVVVYAYKP